MPLFSPSLVSESQFIEVYIVGLLLGVAVLLVVDGHAVPAWVRGRVESPIQVARYSVQRDRFIQQLIARRPLHFESEMVPRIAVRVAGDTGGSPLCRHRVPNVPFVPEQQRVEPSH